MNTTLMSLDQLENAAKACLFWHLAYPGILPKTTVKLLERGLKSSGDPVKQCSLLKEGIRLADIHEPKFQAAVADEVELQRLLQEEALIEDRKLEAITLHNFLDEHGNLIYPSKMDRYQAFLDEIDAALSGPFEELEAWIKRAKDFKEGLKAKLRQAPRQSDLRAA